MPNTHDVVESRYGNDAVTIVADEQTSEVYLRQDGVSIVIDYSQIGSIAQQLCYLMIHLPIPYNK